jgi:hypothetical protein
MTNTTTKTITLLEDMRTISHLLTVLAEETMEALETSADSYDRLTNADYLLHGEMDNDEYLAYDIENLIGDASEQMENAHIALSEFDERLMRLIALRGKLAEEVGVPISGKRWVRYETYTM